MAENTDLREVDSGHSSASGRAVEAQAPEKPVPGPDAELHGTEEKILFQEELNSEMQADTESLRYDADLGDSIRKPDTGIKTGGILGITAAVLVIILIFWKIHKKR